MMQTTISPKAQTGEYSPSKGMLVLLALAGSEREEVDALRRKTRIDSSQFENILNWLQRQDFVELASSLEGDGFTETAAITGDGEAYLIFLLEQVCELPEP